MGIKIPLEIQRKKECVLEDMLSSIAYTPNRESDILAFMEQYQKAPPELRPVILENLRRCMDGKPYPNPYSRDYHYTAMDVSRCETILGDCIVGLAADSGVSAADCVSEVITRLNELNRQCGGGLIDAWREERLRAFIRGVAALAGASQEAVPVLERSMC